MNWSATIIHIAVTMIIEPFFNVGCMLSPSTNIKGTLFGHPPTSLRNQSD